MSLGPAEILVLVAVFLVFVGRTRLVEAFGSRRSVGRAAPRAVDPRVAAIPAPGRGGALIGVAAGAERSA